MQQGNRVFVLNMRGEPLMPCSQRKARILLKEGKAVISKYNPFTICGQVGYITGFASGGAYIKNKNDGYITLPGKSYKQVGISNLRMLSHNNNWQYIRNAV